MVFCLFLITNTICIFKYEVIHSYLNCIKLQKYASHQLHRGYLFHDSNIKKYSRLRSNTVNNHMHCYLKWKPSNSDPHFIYTLIKSSNFFMSSQIQRCFKDISEFHVVIGHEHCDIWDISVNVTCMICLNYSDILTISQMCCFLWTSDT